MKIISICTNYGSSKDGIGHYSYNLMNELEKIFSINIESISGETIGFNKLEKIKSRVMIKAINEYIAKEYNNIDEDTVFIIEYPFLEWNPFIIQSIARLRRVCKKKNAKIILSIHEYIRISPLRRYFTELLIHLSDAIMVTDQYTFNQVRKFKKLTLIRPIPSNILKRYDSKKEENTFCFFGLINKSKSFNEMIEAWIKFNKDNKYLLNIYTSSEIKNYNYSNINVYKNLDDESLSKELSKCKYAILPINPSVALNNGTLKAVAQHKCIPIGIFSEEFLDRLGIGINDNKYTEENIEKALDEAVRLEEAEYNKKIKELQKFGDNFSFNNTAELIKVFIEKIKC